MKNRLSQPDFGSEEEMAILKCLRSSWIGPNGPEVKAFEEELADYLGNGVSVLATNSGTSALHLSLLLLGVGKGDIVLVQSYGYCAPAFAVSYLGAEPVFIDSELDTWGMDAHRLEEALAFFKEKGKLSKVKAIIPVHVFGNPVNLGPILELSIKYHVPILEDAAEAIGSTYDGKALGTIGAIGVLSFNANKVLSAGSGGALISKDKNFVERARFLANQAKIPSTTYHHGAIGYNYAMNDLTAAIARVQLKRLKELEEENRKLKQMLADVSLDNKMLKDVLSKKW